MQIKMRMKYHLIPINVVIIKNTRDNKYWQESGEKEALQKIKNKATILSNNPISEYISKGNKNRIFKRYLHFHVHFRTIHNSQNMETT